MKKLHLIAGLPRSGSTLLCNILNMNPKFHATATSPVIDVLSNIRSTFSHNVTYKTHDRLSEVDAIKRGMKAFLYAYYEDKEVVFDKCRGWVNKLPILDEVLGDTNTKIIWTYRDPIEVASSIEAHYQKTIMFENVDESAGGDFTTLSSRIDNYINDGGLVARPVWLLNDAYEMGYEDRILIVQYSNLTKYPQQTMDRIHKFLGEEPFQYNANDFADLKQTTHEFDGLYNYKFPHTIKEGGIEYKKHNINLPDHIIEKINHRFKWVNELPKQ